MDPKELGIPEGGFSIIFDSCGDIANVINGKGENIEPQGLPMRTEAIEKVISDLTLMYVHSSPGHWCIIRGRARWCP